MPFLAHPLGNRPRSSLPMAADTIRTHRPGKNDAIVYGFPNTFKFRRRHPGRNHAMFEPPSGGAQLTVFNDF
jgi:hypothetical protein